MHRAGGLPWCGLVLALLAAPAEADVMAEFSSYPRREEIRHGDSGADGGRHGGEVRQPDFAAIAQVARPLAAAGSALIAVMIAAHFDLTPVAMYWPLYGAKPSALRLMQAS